MDNKALSNILKAHDFGDDWFEENEMFDRDFTPIKNKDISPMMKYANDKTEWYWKDQAKFYLLADCNSFHNIFAVHCKEYLIRDLGYMNPLVLLGYGNWENLGGHMWTLIINEGLNLLHANWGHIEKDPNYSGKGSIIL